MKTRTITLKDVPANLHRNAKSRAALEDKTLRDFILEAIKAHIERPEHAVPSKKLPRREPRS